MKITENDKENNNIIVFDHLKEIKYRIYYFLITFIINFIIAYSFSNQLELLSIISVIGTYGFNILCISLFTIPSLFILKESKKDLYRKSLFLFLVK